MAGFGDIFGGIIGAAGNLIGMDQQRRNQQELNQQNFNNAIYMDTHHIQDVVADAKAAGINPLAALGVNTPSAPVAVGSDLATPIAQAGQDIGRAVTSYMTPENKLDALNAKLIQAKIDNTNADTAQRTLAASTAARTFAAPGSAPGLPARGFVPLPTPAPHTKDTLPLFQDYRDRSGGRVTLLSNEASQAVMNSASLPMVPVVGSGLVGNNIPNAADAFRPDVMRAVRNLNSAEFRAPEWSGMVP